MAENPQEASNTPSNEDSKEESEDSDGRQQTFRLDRSKISQSSLVDQLPLLAEIGVAAYDQNAFEAGVLEQVDDALRHSSTVKSKPNDQAEKGDVDGDETDAGPSSAPASDAFSISATSAITPRSLVLEPTSSRIRSGEAMPFDLVKNGNYARRKSPPSLGPPLRTILAKERTNAEDDEAEEGEVGESSESEYVPSEAGEEDEEEEGDVAEEDDEYDIDQPSTSSAAIKKGRKRKTEGKKTGQKGAMPRLLPLIKPELVVDFRKAKSTATFGGSSGDQRQRRWIGATLQRSAKVRIPDFVFFCIPVITVPF